MVPPSIYTVELYKLLAPLEADLTGKLQNSGLNSIVGEIKLKYGRTLLATIAVLMIVLSTIPRFSLATPYVYDAKIDKNLWLEEGNSYKVLVRIDWNPDLEPIKFNHDAVINELKREAAETQEPIITHLKQRGAKILNTFWLTNLILIEADANTIQELATLPTVTKIIANFKVTVPKSEIGANTEFTVSGNSSSWNLGKVRAPEVWEKLGVTGRNVRVATTDTGVDISHPDIAGTLWTDDPTDPTYPGGWIEFDEYGNIVPESVPHDTETHGTETYGLILGQTTGMAPDAKGMHALVINQYGIGTWCQQKAGLQWVINPVDQNGNPTNKPAHVSSHSWFVLEIDEWRIIDTIQLMWNTGHFVVAMIGNDGEGTSIAPGEMYPCIGVGATDANDNVWLYSSGRVVSKTEWPNSPEEWPSQWVKPDLSAPGVNVIVPLPGGQYGQHTGTSFAAPHVAGAAVLMLSANPELAVQDIEDILKETAVWYDRYSSERPDIRYGWGRIDAFKAVLFAGFKVTLVIPTGNVNGVYEIANAVKEELAKVRVHVEIEERSASEIADTVWETGLGGSKPWEAPGEGWDMAWYEFNSASETLEQNLKSHYWANMTPPNGYNIMCWNNTQADSHLTKGMEAVDAEKRNIPIDPNIL
jgi:subtilisin family serine protease